jgi:hypothetical protein
MKTLTVQSYDFDSGKVINTFQVLVEDMESARYLIKVWNSIQTTGAMSPPKDTGRRYRQVSLTDSTSQEIKELEVYSPFNSTTHRDRDKELLDKTTH